MILGVETWGGLAAAMNDPESWDLGLAAAMKGPGGRDLGFAADKNSSTIMDSGEYQLAFRHFLMNTASTQALC